MGKVLDLNKNVYTLCKEYPEVKNIMSMLGFTDITKPIALNTMGKMMTIPEGSKVKGISLDKIVEEFQYAGFEVINISET